MKIAMYTDAQTQVVGKRCDRCGHSVSLPRRDNRDGRSAVSLSAELSRFVSIDIDQGQDLHRADLCQECAPQLLETLRAFLPAFRSVASTHPVSGIRIWSYRLIDAETGHSFKVTSLVDCGA